MNYILQTNSLTKKYKNFQALNGLTMNVPKGSIYGFVGKNGAGKTTLIRLICGLQEPTSGDFTLYGIRNDSKDIIKSRRRMGAVVETPSIYMDMTAEENLKQQYLILGLPSYEGIPELLKLVGLENTGKKKAKNFSLGMKQRLGIAIALTGDPDFLVLDEPVNGLDPEGIVEVRHLLQKLRDEKGVTILISSHLLSELSELCTDFTIIDKGKIVESLSKQQLEDNCRNYIAIKTDNQEKLATVLEQNLKIKEYVVREDNEIRVYEKLDDVATISKAITDAGLVILKFNGEGENLEEYFLSKVTTGGSDDEESKGGFSRLFRKAGA